jgi:hypothetical protein
MEPLDTSEYENARKFTEYLVAGFKHLYERAIPRLVRSYCDYKYSSED